MNEDALKYKLKDIEYMNGGGCQSLTFPLIPSNTLKVG